MDLKTQNWKNFTDQHWHDWHGIWTRYTPQGEVQESFRSLRQFSGNSEGTKVHHTNQYIYTEDRVKEESWDYNQQDNALSDGLFHPQAESMRGYFFPSGHSAWLTTQLKAGSYFAMELFFRYQNLRHSAGMVYDGEGKLCRTANIREDYTGFPSQYWSTDLEQLAERSLQGNWQGTSVTITADLKISNPVPKALDWDWQGYQTFFLPDGVSISCLDKVSIDNPLKFAVNWLVKPTELHQLTVNYDQSGFFDSLNLDLLYLSN